MALRAFYYEVLFLTTAHSDNMVHFFLGQFPNMELMLLLPLFLYNCYIFPVGQYNSVFDLLSVRA